MFGAVLTQILDNHGKRRTSALFGVQLKRSMMVAAVKSISMQLWPIVLMLVVGFVPQKSWSMTALGEQDAAMIRRWFGHHHYTNFSLRLQVYHRPQHRHHPQPLKKEKVLLHADPLFLLVRTSAHPVKKQSTTQP